MSEVPVAGVPLNRPAFLAISNNTFQTATVVITLYNGGSPITLNRMIAPGSLYKLDFNATDNYGNNEVDIKHIENPRGSAGSVTKFGVHVESDAKVTAYYMLNHTDSRDIFSLKGHHALGTEFYVPMQSDYAAATNYEGCDQIDIVATVNGTSVTVVPKAAIRIGESGSSGANTPITHTLNKGQTLKIMEDAPNNGSLAGTSITSTAPIAVTVTEDMVAGDTSGDQIVPVASLGTRYIVPRGYLDGHAYVPAFQERFYLAGTEAGTTVDIYATVGSPQTIPLTAGQVVRYTFPSTADTDPDTVFAVYVESNKPVYVYQRSGHGEEGVALLPSVYSIQQTRMSFYQVSSTNAPVSNPLVQKGFLIFRTGAQAGFTIQYGTDTPVPLALTPQEIPNVADWKIARFDFAEAPPAGQIIKVESAQSAFSLGYITGNTKNNNSYGYFSSFGEFEFPEITYLCGPSVTLQGGYAMSYEWTFPDGHTETTPSITATQEGVYTLEMKMSQDGYTVTASTTVRKINAGAIEQADTVICTGETPDPLSVAGTIYPSTGMVLTFQWQSSYDKATWTDIPGATSSTYAPGPLTRTTWYRWKISADLCESETEAVRVKVSSCTLPVNPHLMIRYK
jgi:hypothetical protein